MNITDIIDIKSIEINPTVKNKDELLNRLIDLAAKSGRITNKNEAIREVYEREKIMSTGVGKGLALPHAKTDAVSDSVGSLAIIKEGVEFNALDGEPVFISFLLLGREKNVGNHLRLLSKISRIMNNESLRQGLKSCSTAQEAFELLKTTEEQE